MKKLIARYKSSVLFVSLMALVACGAGSQKAVSISTAPGAPTTTGMPPAPDMGPQGSATQNPLAKTPTAPATSVTQGTEHGGGGGDEVGVEFKAAALRAIEIMLDKKLLPEKVKNQDIKHLVESIQIVITNEVLPVVKDKTTQEGIAINYPQNNMVVVNRARWQNISNPTVQQAVALHECLSILGLESTGDYTYSQKYMMMKGLTCPLDWCEGRTLPINADGEFLNIVEDIFSQIKTGEDIPGGVKQIDIEKFNATIKKFPVCDLENGQQPSESTIAISKGTIAPPFGWVAGGEYISLRVISCGEPNYASPNILLVRPSASTRWYGVTNTMNQVSLAQSYETDDGFAVMFNGALTGSGSAKTMVTEIFAATGLSTEKKDVKIIKRTQTTLAGDSQ